MKHRNYYKFIEKVARKYTFLGAHDPLYHMFSLKDGYSIDLVDIDNVISIKIDFYGPHPYHSNETRFPEVEEYVIFNKNLKQPHQYIKEVDAQAAECIICFPNRTESEDNLLKLKTGKYYADVCRLYTQLNEKLVECYPDFATLDNPNFSGIIES